MTDHDESGSGGRVLSDEELDEWRDPDRVVLGESGDCVHTEQECLDLLATIDADRARTKELMKRVKAERLSFQSRIDELEIDVGERDARIKELEAKLSTDGSLDADYYRAGYEDVYQSTVRLTNENDALLECLILEQERRMELEGESDG